MLKINLLSMRLDAEREYRKMRAGEACDFLTMLEDRTVRRRVHQNIRNDKKRSARINERSARQLSRRRGMSEVGNLFLGANGEPNGSCKPLPPEGTDEPTRKRLYFRQLTQGVKHNHHHEPDKLIVTKK